MKLRMLHVARSYASNQSRFTAPSAGAPRIRAVPRRLTLAPAGQPRVAAAVAHGSGVNSALTREWILPILWSFVWPNPGSVWKPLARSIEQLHDTIVQLEIRTAGACRLHLHASDDTVGEQLLKKSRRPATKSLLV